MKNLDIRLKIKKNRLCHYEIAQQIGISEVTFCVWLRKELSEERKTKVLQAIDVLNVTL